MDIFDKIERLFGFDIKRFFIDYNNFVLSLLPNLISFYQGQVSTPIGEAKKELSALLDSAQVIYSKIQENIEIFDNTQYYSIVDEFEDCYMKLLTYSNLRKWLKSGVEKGVSSQSEFLLDYTLAENESLEQAASRLGYSSTDEGSISLSTRNSIKETDYSLRQGGYKLQVNYQDLNLRVQLESLIDSELVGERLLGYDLSKTLELENGDLKTLSNKDTFKQSSKILLGLKRGDNPEFPYRGVDKTLLVNRATVSTTFPIIFRQLIETFSTDDTIDRVELSNVSYEEDRVNLELNVYSHLQEPMLITSNEN